MGTDRRVADLVDSALDTTVVLGFSRFGIATRRYLDEWSGESTVWADELPSMSGRTAVVTGGSSGLGKAAATRLASLGASVWLLVRDEAKGQAAVEEIAAGSGNDDVSFLLADLADLSTVRDWATELSASVDSIDVLVHNAGLLAEDRTLTVDGIELTLQVHVVAPFLITALLLPQLTAAAGRIITVASGGLYTQPLVIDDLQNEHDYRGSIAYARAKRAQVLMTEEWATRLAPLGITAHVMHPGWADTPGVERSLPRFHQLTAPLLRSPEQGADTVVWLAATPADQLGSGRFWMDRKPRPTHKVPWTRSGDAHRDQLWERLVHLAGIDDPTP
ncbi:MAG: SDR family NAD(P)-dependent oxidoreductase [Acidimicrobiales bacterium]